MAGTLTATTIQNDTSSPPTFRNNSVEIGTLCRAWVNFNGTSTVAIRGSFNVSSITDNGTGNYTVNFTNALPDANYSFVATAGLTGTVLVARIDSSPYSTTQCSVLTTSVASAATDATFVNLAVFR